MKKIIGWTSNQETRASAWFTKGKITMYLLACTVFEDKKFAEQIYGTNCIRKVKITLSECKD